MKSQTRTLLLMAAVVLLGAACVAQQVTLADYARAEQFLPWNTSKLVFNVAVTPQWIDKSSRFVYRQEMPNGAKHFVLVDPATGKGGPAFDHERIAEALSRAAGNTLSGNKLPFETFEFLNDEKSIEFDIAADHWTCDLIAYTCEKKGKADQPIPSEVPSPDKKWAAFLRNHDLYVKPVGSSDEIRLTTDGQQYLDYASQPESNVFAISGKILANKYPPAMALQAPVLLWSPDSKRIATYQLDQRKVKETYLVQSVPPSGQRAVLYPFRFPMPGDPDVATAKLIVFDIAQKRRTELDLPAQPVSFITPFDYKFVSWDKQGRQIVLLQMDRYWKNVTLSVSNAATGATRPILQEHTNTQFDTSTLFGDTPVMRILGDGAEVIWYSERDGWAQLYLYDGKTGALKNRITNGPWVVCGHRAIAVHAAREPDHRSNLREHLRQ